MASKVSGLLWILVAVLFAAAVVVGVPVLARSVPWSYETKLASFVGEMPGLEVCPGTKASQNSIQKLVGRLFPVVEGDSSIPLQVKVIRGKDINAFATLGGRIYIYDGLLQQARSPEELAGVLAHEIEHLRHRHVFQGVFVRLMTMQAVRLALGQSPSADPKLFSMLMHMQFTREQEHQADVGALSRLRAAQIDVAGFRQFFERETSDLYIPEWLSDHPASESRAELSRRFEGGAIRPVLEAIEWTALRLSCARK